MTNLEKLYRARELIESRTGGRQQLALGWDGMPAVRIEDPCMVGVYFALIKNMLTGMYDSRVKGYIRTCGGYRPGARMKDLTEECAQIASLVLDLEKMEISVTKEEAEAFCQNLAEIENREGSSGEEVMKKQNKRKRRAHYAGGRGTDYIRVPARRTGWDQSLRICNDRRMLWSAGNQNCRRRQGRSVRVNAKP